MLQFIISPLHRTSGADVLSRGCSIGLFASPNSSCGLGLGTGGMSSVMQLSHWQFPAMGFLQTFWGCAAVSSGRKPAFRLPVCASLLAGTVALLPDFWLSPGTSCWECCELRQECIWSQESLLAETRFQVPASLVPLLDRR